MLRRLRQLALDRAFGTGAGGFLAGAALNWFVDQVRAAKQPEHLDTAHLVPGETYLVSTRPAPKRAERRDGKRLAKARKALASETAPDRATRRTARKLAPPHRKAAKAKPGSKKQAARAVEAQTLGVRFDRLTAPTAQQRKLEARVAELTLAMGRHRAEAVAATAKDHRPRTRTFR